MAGKSTISITFKLDADGKGFRELSKDAEGFKQVMRSTIQEAQQFNANAINFAAITAGIDQAQKSIQQLQSVMRDLTGAYEAQETVERQLETAMRNTMGATDEDIQSIKDLCSAQQELGVIGDEVQLAGAQELATYLEKKESLQELIPVMNDMLAQQYGLNATQESAAQIASMLGKVMNGQVKALSRYGYKFDEVQEQILKFGDESQRAAVLAQVVGESVGGMNEQLAQTDSGKQKQLENTLGDIKEKLGQLVSGAMPFVTIAANTAIAVAGLAKFVMVIRAARTAVISYNIAGKSTAAMMVLLGLRTSQATAVTRVFSAAMTTGTYTATAFKIALRGLMIATGIGAIITALTAAIEYFVNSTDDAVDSTNDLTKAESVAEKQAKKADEIRQRESATLEQTRALLEINIAKLRDFNGTKAQEKKLVEEMNSTYGETMGYFSSVADWYNALIKNSEAYCRQMVIEAKTRAYANQIAQIEEEIRKARETGEIPDDYKNEHGQIGAGNGQHVDAVTGGGGTFEFWVGKQEAEVKKLQGMIKDAVAEANAINFTVRGSGTRPTGTGGKGEGNGNGNGDDKKEKTRLQEINELIGKAKEQYVTAGTAERAEIAKKIQALTAERKHIELLQKQAERSGELTTLQAIDDEISYQQALRKEATTEYIGGIDAEIERLQKLRAEMERSAFVPTPIDQIQTYEQLNKQIQHYSNLLQTATANERVQIQKQINDLNELKEAWDRVLNDLKKPVSVSAAKSIKELDEAISYYKAKQETASASEIAAIERIIQAYQRKKDAMMRSVTIPELIKEANEINSLTGREYKVKIQSMGFDELTAKIREMQKLLNDAENPVTTAQRKDIEALIGTYETWRKQGVNTFDTFKDGWGSVKGVSNGITSMTEAIEGNGTAWEKTTAIVDGCIAIYEGIMDIVKIMDMLSVATDIHTAAKTGETAAITASTVAEGVNAEANAVGAAATAPIIAANKLATASYLELAAAAYFAAHAYIPFAGYGIAAGFSASAVATAKAIGAMAFAKGGLAYGPTLGLFGEYAGASNNPEVVAPLDRLRGMLQPVGGFEDVEFKLRGDMLVGVAKRRENKVKRGK